MTEQKLKNQCGKARDIENPYEIWMSKDGQWIWKVLKKYQVDDDKPYARWFCGVKSPFTFGSFELGDVYVEEIKAVAEKCVIMNSINGYAKESVFDDDKSEVKI